MFLTGAVCGRAISSTQLITELIGEVGGAPSGAICVAAPNSARANDKFRLVRRIKDERGVELTFVGKVPRFAEIAGALGAHYARRQSVGDTATRGSVRIVARCRVRIALPDSDVNVGLAPKIRVGLIDGVVATVSTSDVHPGLLGRSGYVIKMRAVARG